MSSNRFYLPSPQLKTGSAIELPAETSRQITRVLRMREHDRVVLFDGSGNEWPAEILTITGRSVTVVPEMAHDPNTEPGLDVTVCQALVPAERMEFVIQKSTELGARRIMPIVTERVQSRDATISDSKRARWNRIAVEAAEQSGRTRVPEILDTTDFADSIALAMAEGPAILLWEEERSISLKEAARESLSSVPEHVTVLIGPVGGLSEAEAELATSSGVLLASAGLRVLRAETAPIVALTALMYEAGELG